jgi:hypothetical protein
MAIPINELVTGRFYKIVNRRYRNSIIGRFVEFIKENDKVIYADFNSFEGEVNPLIRMEFSDDEWKFYNHPPPAGGRRRRRSNRKSGRRSTHKRRRHH